MFQFIWSNIYVSQNRMVYKLLQTGVNVEAQSNQGSFIFFVCCNQGSYTSSCVGAFPRVFIELL